MRISFLIGGLIVAALCTGSEPANARGKSAWCARTNTGAGRVQENCGFNSIEALSPLGDRRQSWFLQPEPCISEMTWIGQALLLSRMIRFRARALQGWPAFRARASIPPA